MNHTERARLRLAAIPVTAYVLLMVLIAALWVKPPLAGWIFLGVVALVGAGLIAAAFVQRTRALVPSVDLIELERPADADSWTSIDKTKLSPAERRFVEDDVEGHHMDAVIQGMVGGGDPNRSLDFPPRR